MDRERLVDIDRAKGLAITLVVNDNLIDNQRKETFMTDLDRSLHRWRISEIRHFLEPGDKVLDIELIRCMAR